MMRSYSLAFLAITTIFLLCCCCCFSLSNAEYPGVIELVGYSNRRARTYFVNEAPTLTPPASKTRADIETVKRNMKKYDRLLELDTKNLPEQQKDMLARIVERVARLKESLDIEEQQLIQQEAASSSSSSARSKTTQETEAETEMEQSTLPPTGSTETETDPTLLLDETTLLELQNTMNEQAAIQQAAVTAQTMLMKEDNIPTTTDLNLAGTNRDSQETTSIPQPTTAESEATKQSDETAEDETEESSTFSVDTLTDSAITSSTEDEEDDQFVAARSNNNIAAITAADADPPSTATTSASSSSSSAATAGSQQRTLTTHMGKLKNRATKRPFGHKVTAALKRGGQRPAAALAAANSKPSTASTSSSTSTTAAIQKQKLQQKIAQQATKQQQKVTSPAAGGGGGGGTASLSSGVTNPASAATPSLPIEQLYTRTPQANIPLSVAAAAASSSSAAAAAGAAGVAATTYSNQQQQQQQQQDSMVYDGHVNASALIDSLNTHAREEYYQQKLAANGNKDNKKTATAKPTKYHYYPHNQHIYLLPECAIQQVCNAVYVRLNYTQPLCACPSRYRDPCSASLNEDDQHTTKLVGDNKKKAITLAKTCEATTEMRECRSPKDWSLLALQNTRTGKSHYLVICRCPDHFKMEGPMAHDQPTYASVPGIRVFGMMCVKPGYSVRKPSAQPPKRYQLQKPFYRPGSSSSIGSNQFGGSSSLSNVQKDSYGRPIYGNGNGGNPSSPLSSSSSSAISSNYQPQDQSFSNGGSSSYQYLNRPESSQIHSSSSANFRPDQFSINNFPGSNYGRNNERRGNEPPIEAEPQSSSSTTQPSEEARTTQSEQTESELTTLQQEQSMQEESRSKRSLDTGDEPEFPWDRVLEFQQTIVWD